MPEDGAVVEIDDPEQIAALMAIPDAGFSEVTPNSDDADASTPDPDDDPDAKKEISEIDPNATEPTADELEAKPAAKKAAARKTTASKPVQE